MQKRRYISKVFKSQVDCLKEEVAVTIVCVILGQGIGNLKADRFEDEVAIMFAGHSKNHCCFNDSE